MSLLRALAPARLSLTAPPVATIVVAVLLVFGAAWALVTLPAAMAIPIVLGGSAAVTVWILFPDAPAYALLVLSPYAIAFNAGPLNGVWIQDLILGVLAVAVGSGILAGVQRETRFRSRLGLALILLWLALMIWNAYTYRFGVANRWLMSGESKNLWYTYRQIWRYMLPFPLVALYLRDPHPAGKVVDTLLLSSGALAAWAVFKAPETHYVAIGPFETGNQLSGYLVPIVPFAAGRILMAESRRSKILAGVAMICMVRAMWLSGSRGGFIGLCVSLLPLALFVPRRRIGAIAGAAAILLTVAVFQGGLLHSTKLQRFLSIGNFEHDETFRWREEQWAIFMGNLRQHPWTGTGSDVDKTLVELDRAQTPHNSYLGVAMRSGLPGVALTLAMWGVVVLACVRGLLAPTNDPEARVFWMGLLGAIIGLAVHGLGEATILLASVLLLLWTLLGFAVVEATGSPWVRAETEPRRG
ncbi:MAG TPA: O-antigen ligase family protein [Candidatus Polarisedimenticolia bacterium]|nr:O-antigen ligase family protein [Candidatus Polarisedimenticolia bacterium]